MSYTLIWLSIVVLCMLSNCCSTSTTPILRLGLLIPSTTTTVTGPGLPSNETSWGVVREAKRKVESSQNITVTIRSMNSECLEEIAVNESVNLKDRVDVIIGPVCEDGKLYTLNTVNRLAFASVPFSQARSIREYKTPRLRLINAIYNKNRYKEETGLLRI